MRLSVVLSLVILSFITLLAGCSDAREYQNQTKVLPVVTKDTFRIYTEPSSTVNQYDGFNSNKAINRIADIENEYFNQVEKSYSRYYGTIWAQHAQTSYAEGDTVSIFDRYIENIETGEEDTDSMHCTIYAMEALKAGLGESFNNLKKSHQKIWKQREYAGWSVGYILTEEMGWEAYLIVAKHSEEYEACLKNFKKDGKYHVWKQPDIPIKKVFDFDDDRLAIDSLLSQHEYGWGFSDQGWHTWITRFNYLKECNWLGAPSLQYANPWDKPLFISTKFIEFHDYNSHVVIFPKKKAKEISG